MKTEKEARACWCPFARMYSLQNGDSCSGGWNRHPLGIDKIGKASVPSGPTCIASDCMAWEWEFEKVDPEATYTDQARGDCGLKRGKP